MSNIKINDVFQRIQYTATNGQTQFSIPFPFFSNSYVVVWQDGVVIAQGAGAGQYGITGAGSPSGGTITLVTPATLNSIITIEGIMPIDRTSIYSATISNLTGSDLNGDFNREVVMMKQIETTQALLQLQYAPWTIISQDPTVTTDRYIPLLPPLGAWRMNAGGTAIETFLTPSSGGLAPDDGTYLVQTADADLPDAIALDTFASGFMVNQNGSGFSAIRSIVGVTNQTLVTNGDGISANPAVGIAANPTIPGTEYIFLPSGTTAQRPVSPSDGMVRYNTTNQSLEVYESTAWDSLAGGIVDSVVGTVNQIDVDSSDIQNPVLTLSATLDLPGTFTIQGTVAIDSIIDDDTFATATATNIPTAESVKAYIASFGPGTVTSIAGTTNQIAVDLSVPAVPVISIAANPVIPGTAGITLPKGTVAQRAGAAGTMRFNLDASVFEVTLDGATWVTLDTHSTGDVDSITGTLDQIIASSPTGNVVLSLPQSIATTSSPTFAALTLTAPLTVPNGGSGLASATAYAVICGGTTSTSAFQSIASVGTAGQVLTSNGAGALPTMQNVAGSLKSFQIFTSGTAQTYTRPAGIASILVECVGGGGGGGGIDAVASSIGAAGGGGGGGYGRKWYAAAASTYTYTVGGGGNGGAAGNNNGSTGTNTTFDTMTANGGVGGQGVLAQNVSGLFVPGGVGGGSSGCDVNGAGYAGQVGTGGLGSVVGGAGGGSMYGCGGVGVYNATITTSTAGGTGGLYGGGGSGACSFTGTTDRAGGNGAAGIIIVWEFA